MSTIYILQCAEGKYYIGKTNRPLNERIEEHFNHQGSQWTKRYPVIQLIESHQTNDCFMEDYYTKKYMKVYGIENVRGGSYTQIKLTDAQIEILNNELCTADDSCFRCHRKGHFARGCHFNIDINGLPIQSNSDFYGNSRDSESGSRGHFYRRSRPKIERLRDKDELYCSRCHRSNHTVEQCYAKVDIDGNPLNSDIQLVELDQKSQSRNHHSQDIINDNRASTNGGYSMSPNERFPASPVEGYPMTQKYHPGYSIEEQQKSKYISTSEDPKESSGCFRILGTLIMDMINSNRN